MSTQETNDKDGIVILRFTEDGLVEMRQSQIAPDGIAEYQDTFDDNWTIQGVWISRHCEERLHQLEAEQRIPLEELHDRLIRTGLQQLTTYKQHRRSGTYQIKVFTNLHLRQSSKNAVDNFIRNNGTLFNNVSVFPEILMRGLDNSDQIISGHTQS